MQKHPLYRKFIHGSDLLEPYFRKLKTAHPERVVFKTVFGYTNRHLLICLSEKQCNPKIIYFAPLPNYLSTIRCG